MKEEINLPALHVLVQKELQNRKVYQEADSFINGILGLKQHKNELQKEIDDLQKAKIEAVSEEKRAKESAVEISKKSEDLLGKARADAENLADDITSNAKKKAKDIIDSAKADAENQMVDYDDKILKLKKQCDDLSDQQMVLKSSVAALEKEETARRKALAELKEKFKVFGD